MVSTDHIAAIHECDISVETQPKNRYGNVVLPEETLRQKHAACLF